MLLLALDTSSKTGSAAVFRDQTLLSSEYVDGSGKSASQLIPTIMSVIRSQKLEISQIDCVAVTTGPGSFTGLRVGVTAAKVLAYALKCDVIGVNTLTTIAAQGFDFLSPNNQTNSEPCPEGADKKSPKPENKQLVAAIDAQRNQLFVSRFEAGPTWSPQPIGEVEIVSRDELSSIAQGAAVLGPGLERLSDSQLTGLEVLDRALWDCSAESVGWHASALLAGGEKADFWSLKPNYFRPSSAEEKRLLQEMD